MNNVLGFKDATAPVYDFSVNLNNQPTSPPGVSFDNNGSMLTQATGGLYAGSALAYDPEVA